MTVADVRFRRLTPEVYVIRQRSWSALTVNLYALVGGDGLTLVDAGFPNRGAQVIEALSALGFSSSDVVRVVYTHTHIDHMGGGPDLSTRLGAEHVVWREAMTAAEDWQSHQARLEDWRAWVEEVVDESDVIEQWRARRRSTKAHRAKERQGPKGIAPLRPLGPGERVAAGPFLVEMVPVPGHDPLHVAVYDRDQRVAFTGDVVLPVPTPICTPMGDDTAVYLATLDRLDRLPVAVGYPGHGNPLTNFPNRVERSRRFVTERFEAIVDHLRRHGTVSILELARGVAGEVAQDLPRFPVILANVESSVRYLVQRALLKQDGTRVSLADQATSALEASALVSPLPAGGPPRET